MKEIGSIWVKDIRFWIIIACLIRLLGITNPPLETAHNWRQTTVTMVARNFFENNSNILYPSIDFAGEKTGITGMEFPALNYLIHLTSKVFGYQHWYGRLINLIFSSFGIYFFYLLILKFFDNKTAFYSSIILLFSLWFSYSRKIMPDTFSVSLIIASLYFGFNYLYEKSNKARNLLLFSLLLIIGSLSKIPAAYLCILFIIPISNKKISFLRKAIFTAIAFTSLLPAVYWYYKWVPYLVDTFGFWHFFMGKSFTQGFSEIMENIPLTAKRFYETPLKFSGFGLFIFSIVFAFIKHNKSIQIVLALTFLSFLVIVFKSGFTFSHHTYYIIPFIPVMAFISGWGISTIKNKKIFGLVLALVLCENFFGQTNDFRIKNKNRALIKLESDLNKISAPEDLIIINSGNYPTPMYFAHRKGWIGFNTEISNKPYICDLKSKGLKYIVIL